MQKLLVKRRTGFVSILGVRNESVRLFRSHTGSSIYLLVHEVDVRLLIIMYAYRVARLASNCFTPVPLTRSCSVRRGPDK